MWLLLFVLSCYIATLIYCIVTLIFGLMGASKRADEAEERILDILLDNLPTYISCASINLTPSDTGIGSE
jgi:hypothetical protein